MKEKSLYVIKFDNECYWCGMNFMSPQLRKAKIYTSLKMVNEVAEDCMRRIKCISMEKLDYPCPTNYRIVEVEISEKE